MMIDSQLSRQIKQSYVTAPTRMLEVGNISFAYRELGVPVGVPLVLLNHWGAVLDNFDPRIVDGLASQHRVIAIDYRGIGSSTGVAALTIEDMALDTIELIRKMGFKQVDVLGFSLGGFVAQDLALKAPRLVRKLILAGTGPAGGHGIDRIWAVSWPLLLKSMLRLRDPKTCLFFTSTYGGRQAAKAFLERLKERLVNRDKGPTPRAFFRQLKAIRAWGTQAPQNLSQMQMPVLVVNGDNDIMVPTTLSRDLARRIPLAELVIYSDAGHGSVFQYHADFVSKALKFLK